MVFHQCCSQCEKVLTLLLNIVGQNFRNSASGKNLEIHFFFQSTYFYKWFPHSASDLPKVSQVTTYIKSSNSNINSQELFSAYYMPGIVLIIL